MILKVSPQRSGNPSRLVSYLFGPGKENEHHAQHTVAGTVHYPGAGPEIRAQVTADLQAPKVLWPQVDFNGGHIYHFSLSIGADEGQLPDEKWERIAHEYVQGMKLEDPAKAAVRWTAVRHGLSKEGNDHIHVVVNLIREDGTKASIWQDMKRGQQVVAQIEQRHGLRVLASRHAPKGAGSVPYSQGEVIEARKAGRPVARVELERKVRAAATAAQTEAEFVGLLRSGGLRVRPYPPKSGSVTGYSVALTDAGGKQAGRFYAGGELARDLTLPRIRGLWPDVGGSVGAALAQWRPDGSSVPVEPVRVLVGPAQLAAAEQALHALDTDLSLAGPTEFVELSADLAGAAAAAAEVAPPEQSKMLARASREVGGWAGTTAPVKRSAPSRMQLVALVLMHSLNPDSALSRAFIQRQLILAIVDLVHSHRAARPVPVTPGRGGSMSQVHDDIDGVFGDALTTTAVTGAVVAQRHQGDKAAAVSATRRFLQRWSGGDDALTPRDPVPAGFRGVIDEQDWRVLDVHQRATLDPDGIGRWVTDVDAARPETGAGLRSTATQVTLAGRLGEELGTPGKGAEVAALNRGDAAKVIRRLEAQLTPQQLRDIYHDQMLAYRTVGKGRVSFELPDGTVFPVPETPAAPAPQSRGGSAPAGSQGYQPLPPDWLEHQLEWHTGDEPVTPKQAYTLGQLGLSVDEISKLDKGWASLVISNYGKSAKDGRHVLDQALAAAELAKPVQNAPKPQAPEQKNQPRR